MTVLNLDNERRSPAYREWERQEQAREAARTAKLMAPVQETLREMRRLQVAAWKTPLDKLKQANDGWLTSNFVDLNLPQGDQTLESVRDVYRKWFDTLQTRTGYVIGFYGSQRFQIFVQTQINVGGVIVTADSLDAMFQFFVDNDIFPDGELGFDENLKAVQSEPEPAKAPTFDELLKTTDGSQSREAERRLRDAAETAAEAELGELPKQFLHHLQTVWAFTPDDESWKYLFNPVHGLFVQRNWSLTDSRNYDSARRAMVRLGFWPSSMLTCGEVAEMEYDADHNYARFQYRLRDLTRRGLTNRPRAEGGML